MTDASAGVVPSISSMSEASIEAHGLVTAGVLALAAGRLIAQLFLGVPTGHAAAFGASAAVLLLIAAVAVSIPALRASRVDPLTALRTD